jgi:hypothetical protein
MKSTVLKDLTHSSLPTFRREVLPPSSELKSKRGEMTARSRRQTGTFLVGFAVLKAVHRVLSSDIYH